MIKNMIFKWLVEANVDRLCETRAAWRDDDHLQAEVVDCGVHRCHFVDLVAVQEEERNDSCQCCCNIGLENLAFGPC